MFQPHPNLTKEVNDAIIESELNGGVDLSKLEIGKKVIVRTLNTTYTIEKLGDKKYTIYGSSKYCPSPTLASIPGSTFGGSMLKLDYIGIGMFLEFSLYGGNIRPGQYPVITTSQIQEVTVL